MTLTIPLYLLWCECQSNLLQLDGVYFTVLLWPWMLSLTAQLLHLHWPLWSHLTACWIVAAEFTFWPLSITDSNWCKKCEYVFNLPSILYYFAVLSSDLYVWFSLWAKLREPLNTHSNWERGKAKGVVEGIANFAQLHCPYRTIQVQAKLKGSWLSGARKSLSKLLFKMLFVNGASESILFVHCLYQWSWGRAPKQFQFKSVLTIPQQVSTNVFSRHFKDTVQLKLGMNMHVSWH